MIQKRAYMETSQLKDPVLELPSSAGPVIENQVQEMQQLAENRLPEEDPEIPPSCDFEMECRFEGILETNSQSSLY